jgi:PAS domain S-box-containing protein
MWQPNLYALPLLAGLIPLLIAISATWPYRAQQSARFFLLFASIIAGFMLTYALELLSADLSLMLVWLKFEYIFSLSAPVVWLLFILAYCGHDAWITKRSVVLLFVVPAIHLLAVWTNEFHYLNWATVEVQVVDGLAFFARTYGPIFWIGTIYLYCVVIAATVVMIVFILRSPNLYREQISALILSVILSWLGHILTLADLTFISNLDLTPFGYALACGPIVWSLLRYRLFEVMPAAHDMVVRSMSDAVIIIDTSNRVVDLNQAAETLINKKAVAVIGQSAATLVPQSPDVLARYRDMREAQGELIVGSGDQQRYLDLRISPLYDRGGQFRARIIVLRDVTSAKRAEKTISLYATELEERNRELDDFSHTVAHDLKSPIAVILASIDVARIVEASSITPKIDETLTQIETSANKMTQMIDDLLKLAKLRDIQEAVTTIDVSSVAKATVERLRTDIQARGVQIEVSAEMPAALGHALWIEEVFANLIGNAIKYIGKDNPSPKITICGSRQEQFNRYEVQDNGMGIKPEDRDKLFEKFTRFHQGEASGVGLGLSIVVRMVKRLGGTVGVDSEPGKGSTFWFTLPASK